MENDKQLFSERVISGGKDMRLHANRKGVFSGRLGRCLFLTLLSATIGAYGQNVNGTIVGTVTDATDATVPGASVTIVDENTAVNHNLQTDASGYYSAPDLPPGTYR